ncbi:MAG: carboxypeptidase regulatory-like domain-containing protein, partial [Verrucomicrobiota bacterium]|nr:carboxypeptidase regulatory-like domain-containing protein [Verrucomicrobiota bacterium]
MGLAAPPNDSFASPILIDGIPASETGSNLDATLEAGEPVPEDWAGYAQASVWFSWTASFSGPLRIDTLGSDFDTMLAVWTGSELNSLNLIAHNDDFDSYLSRVTLWVDDGVTYQIAVYGWDTGSGTVVLNLDQDTNSIISGTVMGPDGTTALQGIQVDVYRWSGTSEEWGNWDLWTSGQTGPEGDYIVAGLPEGEYRVGFWDPNKLYAEQFFENATEIRDATVIELPAEQTEVTGIDASLAFSSRITGTVTGPDGTTPLADIEVTAYTMTEWDWDTVDTTTTDADGHYEILGLREGNCRVVFSDPGAVYIGEAYDNNIPAQP